MSSLCEIASSTWGALWSVLALTPPSLDFADSALSLKS